MAEERPHLHVEFFNSSTLNKRRSAEEGRPVYDDIELVRIRFAGDKHNVLVAPANEGGSLRDPVTNQRLTYKQQFPEHYEAFKRNAAFHGSGTPLSELPFLTEAKRRELQDANIFNAESLAALDGSLLQKLGMGARDLKNKAAAYLESAAGSADVVKMAAENAELRERLEAMERMVAEIGNAKAPPQEVPVPSTVSPFSDWDDDTIVLWIVEQGGEKPHHKCSHETLVQKADELNAALAKAKAA